MSPSIKGNALGSIGNRVYCDRCGKRGPQLSERLDANLRLERRLLCTPCRGKLRYRPVTFDRSPPHVWWTGA